MQQYDDKLQQPPSYSYKIMRHELNQHGYGVSLMQYNTTGELTNGFVLISCKTWDAQVKYIQELNEMTGWPIERGP